MAAPTGSRPWDGARALVDVCVERFGAIDGLVNNAAVHHAASPLEENEARLRRIVEVNVLGSLFPAIHAFRVMAARGHGRILNVTSGAHVGLTLEGSIVKPRENYNDEYYGRPIAARAILNMNEGHNPGAGPLRHDLP